jgi:hypothetical protein
VLCDRATGGFSAAENSAPNLVSLPDPLLRFPFIGALAAAALADVLAGDRCSTGCSRVASARGDGSAR